VLLVGFIIRISYYLKRSQSHDLMWEYVTLIARILGNTAHYVGKMDSSSLPRVGYVCCILQPLRPCSFVNTCTESLKLQSLLQNSPTRVPENKEQKQLSDIQPGPNTDLPNAWQVTWISRQTMEPDLRNFSVTQHYVLF
jgi:hypothetical protein